MKHTVPPIYYTGAIPGVVKSNYSSVLIDSRTLLNAPPLPKVKTNTAVTDLSKVENIFKPDETLIEFSVNINNVPSTLLDITTNPNITIEW